MIRKHLIILGSFSLLSFLAVASWAASQQPEDTSGYDKYKVIARRNIFSRDRKPSRPENDEMPTRTKSVVLSLYILRGTVNNAGHLTAFIEEQVSGESIKARVGTKILDGTITEIQYGQVLFEQNGTIKRIRVGEEFGKMETLTTVSADEVEEEPVQEKPEPKEADEASGEEDILKKLMERRQSELSN